MKVCKRCEIEQDLDNFTKCSRNKDGLDIYCKDCLNQKYINDKLKPDFINKRNANFRKHRDNNPEYYKQKDKENYENNKDLWKIKNQIYKSENKDKINEQLRNKYETDIIYRTKRLITSLIVKSIINRGYTKNSRTHHILGCTFEELKIHLESQFKSWMTWENQGLYNGELNYGWDIDHIIPISSALTEEDIIKLNHYTNLQPLCSYTNRYIKANKLNY